MICSYDAQGSQLSGLPPFFKLAIIVEQSLSLPFLVDKFPNHPWSLLNVISSLNLIMYLLP